MIRARLSIASVLDESAQVVRLTSVRWAALLLATSIPYRFMQVVFVDRLLELGAKANQYGDLLRLTADLTIAAFLISLWGRAVYARAARLTAGRGVVAGREALRVPAAALASYLLVASLVELLMWASLVTILGVLFAAILSGLAIGTMELNEVAGLRTPFRHIARYGRQLKIVVALTGVFVVALLVAIGNLVALKELGLWLLSAASGADLARWRVVLSSANHRYVLIVLAGALLTVEPFWIAANVMLVRKAGTAESGDDLRVWFDELRRTA
ncbi:MAG: hypothetical protein ABI837_04335 [Acidobacteriota bacterium]